MPSMYQGQQPSMKTGGMYWINMILWEITKL